MLNSETNLRSFFDHSGPRSILLLLLGAATVLSLTAAQRKEARVSQVVRDVNLLAPHAAARAAHLNDNVAEGSAVHTGADSRTELTFADLTITRIGANSIFSFEENGRNVNVENGAILLRVPTDSGGARIRSSALTVGISGTTVMLLEYSVNGGETHSGTLTGVFGREKRLKKIGRAHV